MLGDISIREYPLYFIPLEHDVLSLELEKSFSELFLVNGPPSNSRCGSNVDMAEAERLHVNILLCSGSHEHPAQIWFISADNWQG